MILAMSYSETATHALMFSYYLRMFLLLIVLYSEKLSREKTFTNFKVLWLFVKLFPQMLGTWHLFTPQKSTNSQSFFHESFLLYGTSWVYNSLLQCLHLLLFTGRCVDCTSRDIVIKSTAWAPPPLSYRRYRSLYGIWICMCDDIQYMYIHMATMESWELIIPAFSSSLLLRSCSILFSSLFSPPPFLLPLPPPLSIFHSLFPSFLIPPLRP